MSLSDDFHPRLTDDLLGHDAQLQRLIQATEAGALASAYLFAGPQGIGKATTAYLFARHLLGQGAVPLLKAGHHPNVYVISPDPEKKSQDIGIEDVREAQHFLHQTSMDGVWRLVLVDAADALTRQASNALLKFLEEPPVRSLFILISHQPGRLLPTIRSRCQKVSFLPLDTSSLKRLVLKKLPELSHTDLDLLCTLYRGRAAPILQSLRSTDQSPLTEVLDLLEHVDDRLRWFKTAERLASAKVQEEHAELKDIMLNVLAFLTKAIALDAQGEEVPVAFKGAFEALQSKKSPEKLAEVWTKVKDQFDNESAFHLDRHYTIESVARLICRA